MTIHILVRWAFLLLMMLASCSRITAKAGPDGRISELSYSTFLRHYDLRIEETKDGVIVQVGAQSETAQLSEFMKTLGPLIGAAAAMAVKGGIP